MAGEVSGGRLGRAESAGIERAADEDPAGTDAVAVSSGHRQESPAVPFRVCAVDPENDPDSAAGAISTEIEPGERGAATEATGANVSASVVPGDGARSETGAAVAGARVSGDSGTGPEDRGRDLLWRRSGGAIGLPRGDYVGDQGPDAGGAQHGAAQFGEHDLGGDRARWAALHGDERQNQRVGLYGVPEAADAQGNPADLSDFGRRQLSSKPAGERLRRQPGRKVAVVLSTSVLPGTEPRRTSVELCETPWRRQSRASRRKEGTPQVHLGPPGLTAKAALDRSHVLSHARDPVRSRLIPNSMSVYLCSD